MKHRQIAKIEAKIGLNVRKLITQNLQKKRRSEANKLTHKIDEIDAKIIKDLLCDGRKSFAEIAKECHVTTNVIRKRFAALNRKGIIVGATTQMNYEPFGYPAVATLLLNVESQHVEKTFESMKKIPDVLVIRQFNSRYGIRLIARLKSMKDIDHIKDAIRLHSSVSDVRNYFWLNVKNNPENLALLPTQGERLSSEPIPAKPIAEVFVDNTDQKIAEILAKNGRMSFRQISVKTGISTDTVIRRYERLVKSGALKVSIQINPEKLGYQAVLDFSIAFAFHTETSAIIDDLAKIPNVIIIIKTSGDYDLHVTAMARDTKQQFEIQEEIAKISNIAKIETAARRISTRWPTESQHISTF